MSHETAAVRLFLTALDKVLSRRKQSRAVEKKKKKENKGKCGGRDSAAFETAMESKTAALRLYVLQMFREGEKILVKPRMTSTR